MNHRFPAFAFAAALSMPLFAQQGDKVAMPAMPDPLHKEHRVLASLVGDWHLTVKMAAMPSVPGMEKATESTGTEHVELVCNGLWLKSTFQSNWQGTPFHGVWLAGYDPFEKKYKSLWVSSDEQDGGLSRMDGSYDAQKKTWSWAGESKHGPIRSVYVMTDADHSTEICYMPGPDGKEVECMSFQRTRSKKPIAVEAGAASAIAVDASAVAAKLPAGVRLLHDDIGTWDAVVTCAAPGMPAAEEKGTEIVQAICNGRWLWSDFRGQFMGAPFEGHAVVGFDPIENKYTNIWIDSMSATASVTTGSHDAKKNAFTFAGNGTCPIGKPVAMQQTITRADANTRAMHMTVDSEGQKSTMSISYCRQTQK